MKKYLIVCLLAVGSLALHAQNKLSDKVYFGGGAGFNTGSDFTAISLSPIVGYKISPVYSVGIGVIYQNFRDRIFGTTFTNYGGLIFNRYNITRQFFGYGEFERMSFDFGETTRLGYSSLNVGMGYSEPLGQRSAINVMALYNLLYNENDAFQPYASPWSIRAGLAVGIF